MNLIYNSENYAILAYPVRYGFELVDKQSRRSLFVQGSLAVDLRAAIYRIPDDERPACQARCASSTSCTTRPSRPIR